MSMNGHSTHSHRDIIRPAQKLHGGCVQMSSPISIYATMYFSGVQWYTSWVPCSIVPFGASGGTSGRYRWTAQSCSSVMHLSVTQWMGMNVQSIDSMYRCCRMPKRQKALDECACMGNPPSLSLLPGQRLIDQPDRAISSPLVPFHAWKILERAS